MKTNNNKQKIPFMQRVASFMYGRNGADTLCIAIWIAYIVLFVINVFLNSLYIMLLEIGLVVYTAFRMFSKNVSKRRKENVAFCRFLDKIKGIFVLEKSKWRDRNTHAYRKCPHCKRTLRLPKVKGKHGVNCPCCKKDFEVNI